MSANNLRLLYDNAADSAGLTASSSAGLLVANNLKTDIKSEVWRATGTSAALTLTWTVAKAVNLVALPFTNFSKTATLRVRGYTNAGDASPVFDTTALACCPFTDAAIFGWDINIPGVAGFAMGGGVYAALFFTGAFVKKLVLDLADAGNPQGYIEAARLVTGHYWAPVYNANFGLQLGFKDASEHQRNDAGDLLTDIKPRSKTLAFELGDIDPADREIVMRILRGNGLPGPVYISVFPTDADQNKVQDYQIYGKLSDLSLLTLTRYASYATSLTVDEI